MARARAEHDRQLKAKASEWLAEVERIRRECAEAAEIEARNLRDKTEKAMKKKVDEAIKEGERKVKEIEKEIDRIREMHREEIKKERERVESMLREQIRIELRDQLGKQFEEEYRE
jgi:HD-GYP domain-containing protein (c-di-GMP phosphodiesterase class II)